MPIYVDQGCYTGKTMYGNKVKQFRLFCDLGEEEKLDEVMRRVIGNPLDPDDTLGKREKMLNWRRCDLDCGIYWYYLNRKEAGQVKMFSLAEEVSYLQANEMIGKMATVEA